MVFSKEMNILDKINNLESRDEVFPSLIWELGLKIGLEVGVREGDYSRRLLQAPLKKLYGIDGTLWPKTLNLQAENAYRFIYILDLSPECSEMFPDKYFDFIHIDADHSYEWVKKDLEAWWPKLRSGGVFSGDDFSLFDSLEEGSFGVVKSVMEFIDKYKQQLYVTGTNSCKIEDQLDLAKKSGLHLTKLSLGINDNNIPTPSWWLIKEN